MNPRLAELIIWFLELGQLYILIYGLVGGLILVGIFLAWAGDQDWGKHVVGWIPLMIIPMMMKQAIPLMNLETDPIMNLIMGNIELLYLFPVIAILLIAIKGVFQ